jgi:hypothetical protein
LERKQPLPPNNGPIFTETEFDRLKKLVAELTRAWHRRRKALDMDEGY